MRALRPGWDGEMTELDLRLDLSTERRDDGADLPMLDPSEFVAVLHLDELRLARIPPQRPRLSARTHPRSEPASISTSAWVAALWPYAAIVFVAWIFRVELVRLLGL